MMVSDANVKAASANVANSLTKNHPISGGNGLRSRTVVLDTQGSATGATTNPGSDITANDFLTLLVTEMKNQDPTQPTDPNAYIQQLVGVNSLQQLISINQELGVTTGATSTASTVSAPSFTTAASNVAATSAVDIL